VFDVNPLTHVQKKVIPDGFHVPKKLFRRFRTGLIKMNIVIIAQGIEIYGKA
jgi:hypothetical protein